MSGTARGVAGLRVWLARAAGLARRSLFANAGFLLAVNLLNAVVGFAFWGWAVRLYAPDQLGFASSILSAVVLLAGIAESGLSVGLIRLLPGSPEPQKLLNVAVTLNVVAALGVTSLFLVGLDVWSPSLVSLRHRGESIVGLLGYAVVTSLGTVLQAVFVARKQAGYAFSHACIVNLGRILFLPLLVSVGAAGPVGATAIGLGVAALVSLFIFLPRVQPAFRLRPRLSAQVLRTVLPFAVGNHLGAILVQLPQMLLPLMALEVIGPDASGYAYLSWMIGSLLRSPGVALASSALAEGAHAPRAASNVLIKASTLGLAVTVPVSVAAGVFAPTVLRLFGLGHSRDSVQLLQWLAGAAPLSTLVEMYLVHLRVTRRVGTLIVLSGLLAATTLAITSIGMPNLGLAASGVGWMVGTGLVAALALIKLAAQVWDHQRSRP